METVERTIGLLWLLGLVVAFAILGLSILWTTRKLRGIQHRVFGRTLTRGEETSLATWMGATGSELEAGSRELDQNPFGGEFRALDGLVLNMDRLGHPESRAPQREATRLQLNDEDSGGKI